MMRARSSRRQAVRVDRDRLAVKNARAHRQPRNRRHREREAVGEVVAVPGYEAHAVAVAMGDDAKTIVLDLVNPTGAARRLFGRTGQARLKSGLGRSARTRR